MTAQLSLFAPPGHEHCCKTCGAAPPDGHQGMFLEPVSGECGDCNYATLDEIIRTGRAGDTAAYLAAWARHYPPLATGKRVNGRPGMDWTSGPAKRPARPGHGEHMRTEEANEPEIRSGGADLRELPERARDTRGRYSPRHQGQAPR